MPYIYLLTNTATGDTYIGKTIRDPEVRFTEHLASANRGSKTHLHSAIRKYGPDNFSVSVLEETVDADDRERYWIAEMTPRYNMTEGGDGGVTRYPPWTPERRQKLRDAHLGRKHTEEHREKRKRFGADNHWFGQKHTAEARRKMSESSKGQIPSNAKPVTIDGVRYNSLTEAGRMLMIDRKKLRKLYYDK